MPPLIQANAKTATYPLTPAKYAELESVLAANPGASGLTVEGSTGTVTFQKVSFAWSYDAQYGELTITITSNHNWEAKVAGNAAIFDHLAEQLKTLA
jgi:hypothetical protein